MKTYQLCPLDKDQETPSCVKRSDGAVIPFDPDNFDYQMYLKWLADGNTPDAAD
jgi:hypothetical protein